MITERTCGAVVFTIKDNSIKYVIVKSLKGFYGFPKGHIEPGESKDEAALREIHEETGINPTIIPGFEKTIEYSPGDKDVLKHATFLLAEYQNQEIKFQKEELEYASLMSFDEALNAFQMESLKDILKSADSFIKKIKNM